jgi:tetratricopeptide (TPR) repeat protein
MSRSRWLALLAFVATPIVGQAPGAPSGATAERPPIYDGLGTHSYPISGVTDEVQAYFDQGLRLYYAFNHAEAIRSYREAQRLDPECAMCWWGEALAWGPNINLPMDRDAGLAAYAAVQAALERRAHASERERAMIEALAVRYAADPPSDRSDLDRAYADALGALVDRYPEDDELRVLHAESLMDLRPWDYWTERGEPRPGIEEALENLTAVQASSPEHPGACHFYIHAVEKLYPERAVPCAERLAELMPGAGHIVHMPGHIYIRVGRYADAVEANRHAIHADETYIRDQRPGLGMYTAGYYPHNYDFLAFALMMIGRGDDAITAADRVSGLLPEEMFGAPGMDFLQHWSARPLLFRVRFERWADIFEAPRPAADRPHALALWHYARGRALAAQGDLAAAGEQLESLRRIAASERLDGLRMEFNRSADLIAIAERVLTGRIAAERGDFDAAVEALREGVRNEDTLLYGEPPEWSVPTRQELGDVLLAAGRPVDAEAAFREDLERFPRNGWSLAGVVEALEAQGRSDEAADVRAELRRVWEGDSLPRSRL